MQPNLPRYPCHSDVPKASWGISHRQSFRHSYGTCILCPPSLDRRYCFTTRISLVSAINPIHPSRESGTSFDIATPLHTALSYEPIQASAGTQNSHFEVTILGPDRSTMHSCKSITSPQIASAYTSTSNPYPWPALIRGGLLWTMESKRHGSLH